MRNFIDIVESACNGEDNSRINEGIVYRDRFVDTSAGDTRRTIIAINPTKAEWDQFFPRGAAGVLCKDGKIVVGDGNLLAHDVILDKAGVSQDEEQYRLQICRNVAWVELWLFSDDEHLTPKQVEDLCIKQYGETIDQITAKLQTAISRFMPGVEAKAIPINDSAECWIPSDDAFRDRCHPRAI